MSSVAICTDSSALFPNGLRARLGVGVIPISVALDGHPFDEREDTIDLFYEQLAAGARATTSQPSPGRFLAAYEAAAARGATEVLSIHLDARLSGTLAAAELAARDAAIPVRIVDTRTVSFGVGVCVRAAADVLARAGSASEAAEAARARGPTLGNAFVAAASTGGRVPDRADWSLLEHVPGGIVATASCHDVSEAIDAMATRVVAQGGPVRVAVGHAATSTEPAATALALSLEGMPHVVEVERYRVSPAVGAHTGALSFGLFWWPAVR